MLSDVSDQDQDDQQKPLGTLWNADDVAGYLRVSISWVRHRVAANKIPHRRVGGWLVRFVPAEIRTWALQAPGGTLKHLER